MSEFYLRLRSTADRLIRSRGRSVSLVKITTNSHDSRTGKIDQTSIEYPILAALFDYNDVEITNTAIQSGDINALMSASSIEPMPGDIVVIDDTRWNVMSPVNRISPASVTVIYLVQLRR